MALYQVQMKTGMGCNLCQRKGLISPFSANIRNGFSRVQIVNNHRNLLHLSDGPVVLTTVSSASAAIDPVPEKRQNAMDILSKSKTVLLCVGVAAAFAFLFSRSITSVSPFASMTIALTGHSNGMQNAAKSAWAGLAAGFLHTLCGPDHLAALTPLSIGRDRLAASALGALWGFGHSTGQLILGLVFVLLKERFQEFMPALSRWGGTVVGLTLITIGVLGCYEALVGGGEGHEGHGHEAIPQAAIGDGGALRGKLKAGWATYATGIVYGLQPDALFVVIPALALPTQLAAFAYCTSFVAGTVAAMGGYTALLGETSTALISQHPWLKTHLSTIASGIAIVVGMVVIWTGCSCGHVHL